jgi:hypothetical protein
MRYRLFPFFIEPSAVQRRRAVVTPPLKGLGFISHLWCHVGEPGGVGTTSLELFLDGIAEPVDTVLTTPKPATPIIERTMIRDGGIFVPPAFTGTLAGIFGFNGAFDYKHVHLKMPVFRTDTFTISIMYSNAGLVVGRALGYLKVIEEVPLTMLERLLD